MTQYKALSTSRKDIENYVYQIKETLGLENRLCFPVIQFLELIIPNLIDNFNYEIVDDKDLTDKYAETIPSKNLIRIRNDVYEGACNNNPRDRFTIAHEIGHLFMHDSDSVTLCRISHDAKIPAFQDPEWQANTFAGYLLMTPACISGLSVEEICVKCKVSNRAAKIQMKFI
ncbi:ImmA/IrrE family metallo-endopeptidase [Chakrabartyella piscis]|uniref:ImmA/IrrE family metallo-endopeptidase n=1 Tax=Chakrabartyella piscis TaxID=2918914 RepID=UPI002958CFA8|nr:ImmA/IrrE family metallo-endopeptidase [Chakrabartyella piscis]